MDRFREVPGRREGKKGRQVRFSLSHTIINLTWNARMSSLLSTLLRPSDLKSGHAGFVDDRFLCQPLISIVTLVILRANAANKKKLDILYVGPNGSMGAISKIS